MTILGGVLEYLGLLGVLAGIVSLLKPVRFLGIRSRSKGTLVGFLGLVAFAAGVYLPAAETRVGIARTRLDEFVPVYQFSEFHTIDIGASADRVEWAIRTVTPEEIRFYQTLTWIRRFGRPSPPGILNPPERRPILDLFTAGAFHLLADDPGREIVFGHAGDAHGSSSAEGFKTLHQAPLVKIAMNFRIRAVDAAHCTLSTETRVYAVGPQVVHGFAAYWRMIYPGSSLIRHEWLRAIKLRAEATPDANRASGVGIRRGTHS